ncbi:MAG: extracellular solute-binding protein [candidate division Zixibacteria bacterium]|nr:extracellular solute-binding protein [candidate division Zixibacteria bacterium]
MIKRITMESALFLAAFITFSITNTAQAKTTLQWWQFWTDPDIKPAIQEMVSDFERENPDIQINITDLTWANGQEKIAIAFASKTGPDIVELGSDWIAKFADAGQLAEMGQFIAADSNKFQGWGLATYKNTVYARPWILGTRVIFGNRDLLAKAGYGEDFVPVTLIQLGESAFKIDQLSKEIYGWGSNTAEKHRLYKKFLPFFWTAGAQIFSEDNKYCLVASDMAIASLRFYKMLHDSCGYVADQRGIEDAFLDGKVGYVMSGDWLLKRITLENRKINLMSTIMPGLNFPGRSFLGGEFLAINEASENKEAASKFIAFVTSAENQVRFCKAAFAACPSSIEAQADPYFSSNNHFQSFISQIRMSKYPPVDPDWSSIEQEIERAVEDALFGSGLIATPLRNARIAISKIKAE